MSYKSIRWSNSAVIMIVLLLSTLAVLISASTARAANTLPSTMNFQGRLTDATGNVVANGSYNVRFTIYNASSAAIWTETRETTNRVTVSGGLFNLQLGSVVPLTPSLFASTGLTLGVTMANPATATCSTAACQTWEAEMTPRSPIATSAYAFNADTVDGIDGASLAQLGANTFTGNQTINTTSTSALAVGTLLTADTTNSLVKVGTSGTATGGATVRLLSTAAEFSTSVRVGNASNGVDITTTGITYRGTARPVAQVMLSPEYPGATFTGSATSNGTLTSDFCANEENLTIFDNICNWGESHNYYQWTSTQSTAQDYNIYIRYRVPADYASGSMNNLELWASGAAGATEKVTVELYSDGGAPPCLHSGNINTVANTWQKLTVANPIGSCSIAAGDMLTFRVHLEAAQNRAVQVGELSFSYERVY